MRPLDQQRFDTRPHLGGQQRLDALRRQCTDARTQAITLGSLGIERDAELAQLLHGFPYGGARDRQIRGQRFAGLELAVVEALEYALGQRPCGAHGIHVRPRPNSHSRCARGSVPARMRRTLPRWV